MKAPFNGVDNINCRKEGENGNEERRKRDRFLRWNLFFENNKHINMFLLDIHKNIFLENEFRFSKQN